MKPKLLPPDLLERCLKSIEENAPISEVGLRSHIEALTAQLSAQSASASKVRAEALEEAAGVADRAYAEMERLGRGHTDGGSKDRCFARAREAAQIATFIRSLATLKQTEET